MTEAYELRPATEAQLVATSSQAAHLQLALDHVATATVTMQKEINLVHDALRQCEAQNERGWWESPWAFPAGMGVGAVITGLAVLLIVLD